MQLDNEAQAFEQEKAERNLTEAGARTVPWWEQDGSDVQVAGLPAYPQGREYRDERPITCKLGHRNIFGGPHPHCGSACERGEV